MDQSGLRVAELRGGVTCHTKIGILIDGTGDETRYITARTEDMGKTITERGGSLDGRKTHLSARIRFCEAEAVAHGIPSETFFQLRNIRIEGTHVLQIREDECLVHIISTCNDVRHI